MIPLDDPLWSELRCHCITGREFADILEGCYAGKIPMLEELYEDLLECICGGDVYDSSFAAAPHLIRLSSGCSLPAAVTMLCVAARAIAETSREEGPALDPRLTTPLKAAACEGVTEAMKVLESSGLDTREREEMEIALLAFSGDFEGFWQSRNRIDEQLEAEFRERAREAAALPVSRPELTVVWDQELPSSQTSNGR
ncbi:hypothetical protein OKA05_27130 [Luteolibacter arcticus]|uniref:Uncharacterized protein n=1 Tax=Luteolibacter arcticus TaxID=1581411 RepID=A0ABT3GRZ4_9BACT|nr:hypothetical protein [Luteolibacter arcticus]MCW1926257.1 hypothetical protein [Luteolibacter arcticus]